jgi:hypothetical protein
VEEKPIAVIEERPHRVLVVRIERVNAMGHKPVLVDDHEDTGDVLEVARRRSVVGVVRVLLVRVEH